MRDRLIELINQIQDYGEKETDFTTHWKSNERLADYLLENGVIIPPVKVGDTMYFDGGHFASRFAGEIMERRVDVVLTEVWATFRGDVDLSFDFEDFGKRVFLTREEAEQAITERGKK